MVRHGSPSEQPRQYTLRHVPPEVDAALRRRAREQGRSLNEVALEALRRGAGLTADAPKVRDLGDVAGTWEASPDFDQAIADMDAVDPEMWR